MTDEDERKKNFEKMLSEIEQRIIGDKAQTELVKLRKKIPSMALVIGEVPLQTIIPENTSPEKQPRSLRDFMELKGWKA